MSAIASVGTQPKQSSESLDPRATRYGLLPIWSQPTSSYAFYVWNIPANQIFPFRTFTGEVVWDAFGNKLSEDTRLPAHQVTDMYTMCRHFIELPDLALLNDGEVEQVAAVVQNSATCPRYEYELGTECISCWLDYLRNDAPATIRDTFQDLPHLKRAAIETASLLAKGFAEQLDVARRQVDEAIRLVDDPDSGKKSFTDAELLSVYHTHGKRPEYRTSTSNTDIGKTIADAIAGIAKPAMSASDLQALIATAVEAGKAELKAELAAEQAVTSVTVLPPGAVLDTEETYGQKMARIKAEKAAEVTERANS